MLKQAINKVLTKKMGCGSVGAIDASPGVLNQCFICDTDKGRFFVKTTNSGDVSMYAAEARALEVIDKTETVRVPLPHYFGSVEDRSFIVMEHIDLLPHTPQSWAVLGIQLANMHLATAPKQFGFDIDNTIGTTPQSNRWEEDWIEFFKVQRLQHQLDLIEKNFADREVVALGTKLLENIASYFEGITVRPSLLHGDLWHGNTAIDTLGNPVIFDPASYYGHHEAELGIAVMFGGFSKEFFDAYYSVIPREEGVDERIKLYRLYHTLNHYNIFGSSYRPACLSLLEDLVA